MSQNNQNRNHSRTIRDQLSGVQPGGVATAAAALAGDDANTTVSHEASTVQSGNETVSVETTTVEIVPAAKAVKKEEPSVPFMKRKIGSTLTVGDHVDSLVMGLTIGAGVSLGTYGVLYALGKLFGSDDEPAVISGLSSVGSAFSGMADSVGGAFSGAVHGLD